MKSGTGNDPFADDDEPSDQEEASGSQEDSRERRTSEGSTTESQLDRGPSSEVTEDTATDESMQKYPYAIRRDSVKEGRKSVMFELREEYRGIDEDIREALAERWGKAERDIPITDVREAMVAISEGHVDEIATVMEEWGCDA